LSYSGRGAVTPGRVLLLYYKIRYYRTRIAQYDEYAAYVSEIIKLRRG
jgi:hypothetical protein